LPNDWLGGHAAVLFADYYNVLTKPATEFFETIFSEGNDEALLVQV